MVKKFLMTATVPSMIGQFNMENIRLLQEFGYEVHVACNFHDKSVWTDEKIEEFKNQLKQMGVRRIQIDFARTPFAIKKLIQSYMEMKKLFQKEKYAGLHCHTPVAGMIARLAARGNKMRVIYTAHGFHFYKGAPFQNWLLYYPVEKFLSRYTDVLITINKEDYQRAKKKFHAKEVQYIPGVGVDVEKFLHIQIDKKEKREEMNISDRAFVLLSVGELAARKNHMIVIKALYKISKKNIFYLIVGEGELKTEYESLIQQYKLDKNIFLLGYRKDIGELCKMADCFVHPSIREGLGIAPLEAMACGLPLIASNVNGIKDYAKNEISGINISPDSVEEMVNAILKMYNDESFREKCSLNNLETVKSFDIHNTNKIMKMIYSKKYY